jgi:hypothetical protein
MEAVTATASAPPPAVPAVDYAAMALELATTKQQLAAVTQLVEQLNQAAAARAAAAAQASLPTPAGVQDCLHALQQCLHDEGFAGQRFLAAQRLADFTLHHVELCLDQADSGDFAFVVAARMTATIDRAKGRLELRCFEGVRHCRGDRTELPAEGFAMQFAPIDGRAFEARLPALVRAEGDYPAPEVVVPSPGVDPLTRRQWLRRLEQVMSRAGTAELWRITNFRGMQDGWFTAVEVVATNEKHLVVGSAHCDRAAIEVDHTTGVVSLRLQDGVLRREGRESSIRGEGYRMLLPKLTPGQVTDAMFGIVVTK